MGTFGMKAQIGIDSRPVLIHSVLATAARCVWETGVAGELLHGQKTEV